ncbi:hypothetical protein DMN91_000429 [Ooceraea biroi]|uniref:UXT-like protein n=1 Tax=Ooceraea biroi TaxID=2015173 RepID=A0A026WVC2_OOCBI|nr:protein UXT homolog [Ooceraea biroi]EZA59918.1 UXT-like protein [Ooceraea biroi]RLU26633.1 hypothetical protein DMN91_000429 [Ooceraea biroi]
MEPQIHQKVVQFETFVNEVLKEDLKQLENKLDAKNADIAEFLQLQSVITTFQNTNMNKTGFNTKIDIGHNFFMQAHVTDVSEILLNIGLGIYVEFTLDEALTFINVRSKLLERQVANLRKAIAMTNAHIKLILLAIGELQGIGENVSKE